MIDINQKQAALLPGVKLQPHQERVRQKFLNGANRMLLLHAMGSGKSLSGLGIAESFGDDNYTAIVPASLRNNIRKEQARFTDGKSDSDIMSYTGVGAGIPVRKSDTILMDEAQRIRNPDSAQGRNAIREAEKAKRVVLMSGTPIVNDPGDFATPYSILTGKRISPTQFRERYVGKVPIRRTLLQRLAGVPRMYEQGLAHEEELRQALKGKVDYYAPDNPSVPVTHEDVEVEMSPVQDKLYDAMWGKLPWVIRWKMRNDFPLDSNELLKARSFLTGPRQVGLSTMNFRRDKDPLKAFEDSTKLQKALSLMQEKLKDERTKGIVFSNYIDSGLQPYSAALTRAGISNGIFHGGLSDAQRKELVDNYNSGKTRVALLGPSGAEGISFKGTQLVQMLDPYWNSVRPRQSEARGIRFDSHTDLPEDLKNVNVQRFIARTRPGFSSRLLRSVGLSNAQGGRAVDDHLITMADRKDRENQAFIDLLRQIGSEK